MFAISLIFAFLAQAEEKKTGDIMVTPSDLKWNDAPKIK